MFYSGLAQAKRVVKLLEDKKLSCFHHWFPETGRIVQAVDNSFYIRTTGPDGVIIPGPKGPIWMSWDWFCEARNEKNGKLTEGVTND